MEYVEEKIVKNDKIEEYPDEDVNNCNDDLPDGDAEDEAEDDIDDNEDVDDDCPVDNDYDNDDDFRNDFGDGEFQLLINKLLVESNTIYLIINIFSFRFRF